MAWFFARLFYVSQTMSEFKIRQVKNEAEVARLFLDLFPDDDLELYKKEKHWLVYQGKRPVGFCSVMPGYLESDTVFLSKAGLLGCARGQGLHKRMIRVRLNWCKKNGYKFAVTYVHRHNGKSAYNLCACGFKVYTPASEWAGKEFIYFLKVLAD